MPLPALSDAAMTAPPASALPAGGVHRLALRVYFEDVDAAGIVYHARYLHFMERGRTEYLRALGIDHAAAVRAGLGAYAVTDMTIRWQRPARLDDLLWVETRLLAAKPASCRIAQTIGRDGAALASAELTAALLDPAGRPRRQPAEWMALYAAHIRKDQP
jgi:acyl-CoA thioester hydrolase